MIADSHAVHDVIGDFSLDPRAFREANAAERASLGLAPDSGTTVLLRGQPGALRLSVDDRGSGNRLYLNDGASGKLSVGFSGSHASVYLGRDSSFADQHIGSRQDEDLIAVGNDVAITGPGRWISGLQAGTARPALIVGDACVLSRDVIIRNSDGHPVMDAQLQQQCNQPAADLVIEPHCWIGERAAILKGVRLGAFAVVGLGAVVSRSVPRHCHARGNPAENFPNAGLWCWDDSPDGLARARHFLQRYPRPA